MSVVSIPSFTEKAGVVYYNVNVQLPLRSIETSKRYSDFMAFASALCVEMGISKADFPYPLPPKGGVFAQKQKVARERQVKLAQLLTHIIKDRDLQNTPLVHDFLQLPRNFKFTLDFFTVEAECSHPDEKFLITDAPDRITRVQWLSYVKNVRKMVDSLDNRTLLAAKMANREKTSTYIRPNVEKLTEALRFLSQSDEISHLELKQRASMLSSLQSRMEDIVTERSLRPPSVRNVKLSKSVFSHASAAPVETEETKALSNKALIQHQQQIHKDQDQDLEQLRKIIARQREIGETINAEIEEQLEILDLFSNEVDVSGEKLRSARGRVKKINCGYK